MRVADACSASTASIVCLVRSENMAGRSDGPTIPGTTEVSNFPSLNSTSRTPAKSLAH